MTSRSAAGKGNDRSTTPLTTLKMAVVAPMPSASVSTATAVKPGFFTNCRTANLRSFISQRLHRIDFCCSTGGDVAREQGYGSKNDRHGAESERVSRLDVEKDASENTSESKGSE